MIDNLMCYSVQKRLFMPKLVSLAFLIAVIQVLRRTNSNDRSILIKNVYTLIRPATPLQNVSLFFENFHGPKVIYVNIFRASTLATYPARCV